MTNDKVNPTGQIDSQATTIIKIHSVLIVWLFVLTAEHWNQQSESYSQKSVHQLIPIFICVWSNRIYVML